MREPKSGETTHTISLFLKFGNERDIFDLYENGTIYMNPIQKFREVEDGNIRGDSYEAITAIKNYPPGEFEIASINYKGRYQNIHLQQSYENVLGNIYSLYCISSHGFNAPEDVKIDYKMQGFGSHFLLIKDNIKFLTLLIESLKSFHVKYYHGFVEYYDKYLANGSISVLQKPDEFEYQKEFRIYAERISVEPLKFSIGSLKNIAQVHRSEDISELTLISK